MVLAAAPLFTQADQTIEARALASQMIQQLGAALKKELAANGPVGAISVCRDAAPAIAGDLSRKSGGRVARVSLKIRNPLLGDPDVWEQRVLAEFDRRAGAGEKAESLEYFRDDRATGYTLGQIRGAVTIKQPLGAAQ